MERWGGTRTKFRKAASIGHLSIAQPLGIEHGGGGQLLKGPGDWMRREAGRLE